MRWLIMTLLLWAGVAVSATLEVPGTYATINAAVSAVSGDGDIINVAAGTYRESSTIGYIAYDFTIQGATGTRTDVIVSGPSIGLRVASGQTLTLKDLTFEEDADNSYGYLRVENTATLALNNVWIDVTKLSGHIICFIGATSNISTTDVKISADDAWVDGWTYALTTDPVTWNDVDFTNIYFQAASPYPSGPQRFIGCTFQPSVDTATVIRRYIDFHLSSAPNQRVTIQSTTFTGGSSNPELYYGFDRKGLDVSNDTVMTSTFNLLGVGVFIHDATATNSTALADYFAYNSFTDCVNYGIATGSNYSVLRGNTFYESPSFGNLQHLHCILLGDDSRPNFTGDVGAFNVVAGNYVDIYKGYLLVDKGNDSFCAGNKGTIRTTGACFMVKGAPRGRYVANYFESAGHACQLSQQSSTDPVDYTIAGNYFKINGAYALFNENVTIDGMFGLNQWDGVASTAFYNDGPGSTTHDFAWYQANIAGGWADTNAPQSWRAESSDSLFVISYHSGLMYDPDGQIGGSTHWNGGWK